MGVDEVGGSPVITYAAPQAAPAVVPAPVSAAPAPAATAKPAAKPEAKPAPEPKEEPATSGSGTSVTAPMPGMVIKYGKVGDSINEGETIVVIEAMKMENALPAPASGVVKAINFSSGDSVAKGDILAVIE